ncbi:RHS repeat domain-containing protein [Lysobacter capsici]|uniref:RHS repeat domain-containing protein n=1 Tax=Lysobacter capsici TaxID=435897 RepID=UPI0007164972|nr:RHS repeat-associated core domain-containing protein [Lysobacter capsici]
MSHSIFNKALLTLALVLPSAFSASAGEALILLSPDGPYYAPAAISVQIQCVSDDDFFPKTVKLYLDDALLRTSSCTVPDYSLNLGRGHYNLRTVSTDAQGNTLNEAYSSFDVLIPGDFKPSVDLHQIPQGPYSAPATIPLSVTAADSDGQVVSVEYFANGQSIGTSTQTPFGLSWTGVAAGQYTVTAKATDNNSQAGTSQARTVTVGALSILGQIEGVRDNGAGGFDAYGWACLAGNAASIEVQFFARDPAPNGGMLIGTAQANQSGEPALSTACRTSANAYRFTFPLTEAIRRAHPNKKLYAYGVAAGASELIGQSGLHSIPGWQMLSRRFVYDQYQQLCKTIEPEIGATVMEYDGAGNLAWSAAGLALSSATTCNRTEAQTSGRKVTRSYHQNNKLYQLTFPGGAGNQSWLYYPDGLPESVYTTNLTGPITVINSYGYNKRRLPTGESNYSGDITYQHDRYGNVREANYSTRAFDYAPNALGQPTTVRDNSGQTYASAISYYPNGALKSFVYGNGIIHTMVQNARQLPARSTDAGIIDLETGFDPNGNVVQIYDRARGDQYNRSMQYDDLDRLQAVGSCSFGGDCWHRFTYDALDNLKSWSLGGVKDHRYYYDTRNQLTNVQNAQGASIVGMSYDPQGNLTNKNGRQFKFDYGNRLREVVGLDAYAYDAAGLRISVTRNGSTAEQSFYASGQLLRRDFPDSYIQNTYVYLGGSLIAQLERVPTDAGDTTHIKYQHTDALGSPVATTNEAGQVIDRTDWEPYGAAIGKPAYDGVGYTGHLVDGTTGLTYMQQRYYDQTLGIFLSIDPVTADGSTGANFNRYWYANNSPYTFTDPDGRFGRGAGWSNAQWAKFNSAQTSAATSLERAAGKITKALETGEGLNKVTKAFEKNFGQGSGTVENLSKVATTMSTMASALRDDGSAGFMAEGMTASAMSAKYTNMKESVMAGVAPGTKTMIVNLDHPLLGDSAKLSWTAGHESGHAALGLKDQMLGKFSAYKFGTPMEKKAFKNLPANQKVVNPDHIMDLAK